MRPRSSLVELFSTFLRFEGDRSAWIADAGLQRSMAKAVQTAPAESPIDEKSWAIYWHSRWSEAQAQTPEAARYVTHHLIAYLQEPSYWGAHQLTKRLRSPNHRLSDLFQEAMTHVTKVLNGFDPLVGCSLRSYAEQSFINIIRDQLRQRREVDACTPWGLLNRVSQKRLTEALQRGGVQGDLQQQYLLAWRCYREHYGPTAHRTSPQKSGLRKLPQPSAQIWQAIAITYNRERIGQLTAAAPAISPAALETYLMTAVKLLRNLQTPGAVSLDAPIKGREAGDFYDLVPDEHQASPLGELINQEHRQQRQQQQKQLNEALVMAIAQLEAPDQALLQVYYGEQLTQREIASRLALKQYSISRKLSRLRQKLLKALLNSQAQSIAATSPMAQTTAATAATTAEPNLARKQRTALHTCFSPAVLDAMGNSLEDWLTNYYRANHANTPNSDSISQSSSPQSPLSAQADPTS